MFTTLIDTPGRTKLATFFLSTQPRSFHPEEIRKAVGESGPTVAANLRHFAKSGFIRTTERKGEIYYRVSGRYPYLEELRGFLVKKGAPRYKDLVWQELEKLNNTYLILLTGLFTGQTSTPSDLIVVGQPSPAVLKKVVERIEKEMRLELFYTIFSREEFDERFNMQERFTRDIFENPHLIVVDKRGSGGKKP
jgi:hypothetical protein